MGEQKDDIRQYLADEKFSDEEVDDILERAGKIQHEADVEKGNVDRADLEFKRQKFFLIENLLNKILL